MVPQAPLAVTAAASALLAACFAQRAVVRTTAMAVAAAMAGIVALTLLVIYPTNDLLLGKGRAVSKAEVAKLLREWQQWHFVRVVLSMLAFGACVTVLVRP